MVGQRGKHGSEIGLFEIGAFRPWNSAELRIGPGLTAIGSCAACAGTPRRLPSMEYAVGNGRAIILGNIAFVLGMLIGFLNEEPVLVSATEANQGPRAF